MTDTETLNKIYLEWSQFTKAMTRRDLALERIANSKASKFDDPTDHANWCVEEAKKALRREQVAK